MREFLSKNLMIVLGVSLPIVLIVVLFVVQITSKMLVAPPAYKVLLAKPENFYSKQAFNISIKNNRLSVTYKKPDRISRVGGDESTKVTLYIYDAASDDIYAKAVISKDSFINPEDPGRGTTGRKEAKPVEVKLPPPFYDRKYSADFKAPDGYRFEADSGRREGVLPGLFGFHGHRSNGKLVKSGAVYGLPDLPGYRFSNQTFQGWVIDDR